MKRLLTLFTVAVLVSFGATSLGGSRAGAADEYRVDAIFDTAKGIIPGQLVKIAGARVGTVKDVVLTDDAKARIQMQVEQRFAPFRSDASCQVQPEGLISENFVQCEPGTPAGQALSSEDGEAPTVPVERTSVPVNLSDLFNIFTLPTRERFTVVVAELGAGFAARGPDVNEILRRANPTLQQTRKVITILNRQRNQVSGLVRDTDRLVAELAQRRDRVADFVDQSARVTTLTANRRGALAEGIRRLPGLLRVARPALRRLDELGRDGTPILRDLRAAAPDLARLVTHLKPFARAGRPAIRGLSSAAIIGRKAVKDSRALVRLIRRFARAALPTGRALNTLVVNLRDRGVVEALLAFTHNVAGTAARFDATSHLAPAYGLISDCGTIATTPTPECDARYTGATTPSATIASRSAAKTETPDDKPRTFVPNEPAAPPAAAPGPQAQPQKNPVNDLLDRMLGDVLGEQAETQQALKDLGGYLFG